LTEENRIILIQETRKKDESGALHLGINKGYIAWKKTFTRKPLKSAMHLMKRTGKGALHLGRKRIHRMDPKDLESRNQKCAAPVII